MIVVVGSPVTRQALCGRPVVEDFQGKKLIAEAAVEALNESVLPRARRFNVKRAYIKLRKPLAQSLCNEFWAIVATNELWKTSLG